jgi:endogenous inhibitor of DNA gyrase (YacG/DUF329 family)
MTYAPCEGCGTALEKRPKTKRFCSERCRRISANRRYRERRTEVARCKGCGARFTRTKTSKRVKVYCSLTCQPASRSKEYRERPDISRTLGRATTLRREPYPFDALGRFLWVQAKERL